MASSIEISALRQELARQFGQMAEQRAALVVQLDGLRGEVAIAAESASEAAIAAVAAASAAASAASSAAAAAFSAAAPATATAPAYVTTAPAAAAAPAYFAAVGLDVAAINQQLAEFGASARVQLLVSAVGLLVSSVGSPALAVALLALGYRRRRAASMLGAYLAALVAHPSTTIAAGVLFCGWRAGLGVRNVGRRVAACFRRSAPPPVADVEMGPGATGPAENDGGQGGWIRYLTSFLPGRGPQPS